MSSIVNKVKDALHSDKSSHTENTHSHAGTTAGHTTGTTGGLHESAHAGTGTHEGAYGTDSNRHNGQRTDGPHGNLGNKLDPRVDSDRDHSRNLGANPDRSANTTSHTGHTGGLTGSHGTHTGGLTGTSGTHSTGLTGSSGTHTTGLDNRHNAQRTDGPHGDLGNKLDPRVDSDRDHSRNLGANPDRSANTTSHTGHTGGLTGSHGTHTGGLTGSHAGTTTGTSGLSGLDNRHNAQRTDGPHGDLGNKLDPRVDSDRDHSRNLGANPDRSANTTSHTGHTGGLTGSTGTHTGGLSGSHAGHTLGSSTGTTGATTGLHGSHTSGPAPNTQGPHKSDLLNKADPRVDSDADGSKTYGGDKTFAH